MKQRCSKTIMGILLVNVIFVVCFGLYLNAYKDNIQQFHRGNYVEANNNNNYFNLDLYNQSI